MAMMSSVPIAPPPQVRLIPTLLASLLAIALFVVGLSVAARLTADDADMTGLGADDAADDAADNAADNAADVVAADDAAGVVDAGVVDAGVVVTVDVGPDAGPEPQEPPTVEGPPYDAHAVAVVAAALVQDCARDALRWDPSLGGPFTLKVTLPAADSEDQRPIVQADGLRSPVLQGCLERRQGSLALPGAATGMLVRQMVTARAALLSDGTINVSDEAVVAP